MRPILTLALKDIKLLFRDKAGLFWIIGFPLLMALFFGAIFGGSGGGSVSSVQIAIVDEDNSEYSQKFVEKLSAAKMLEITNTTADSALALVRKGKKTAFLKINKGFTKAQKQFKTDSSFLELGVDPSKRFTSELIKGIIIKTSFEMMMDKFSNPQAMISDISKQMQAIDSSSSISPEKKIAYKKFFSGLESFVGGFDSSIMQSSSGNSGDKGGSFMDGPKIKKVDISKDSIGPRSSYEITFPAAILWALIGCTSAFAVSIVTEKTKGTYTRLRIAPISRAQILAGKGLACFITIISVSCILLLLGKIAFGIRLDNIGHLTLALFASAFCFVGLMMFISVIGKTEQAVGGAGMAIMLIMSMTGGGMIPLFAMPKWMLTISNFSFVKWGIVSLEGAIWRGYSYTEMILPISVLIGSGIILFAVGVTILTKRDG